ncbi:MAG: hypothetical protein ACT4P2_11770, partial [Pseudomonadota bacterium]
MAVAARVAMEPRWARTLRGADTLADDLAYLGEWVGPRAGAHKRSHRQKEDYVLRRLLVAWKLARALEFPVDVRAATDSNGGPDFVLAWPDGGARGVEITEAGEEDYQAWLTRTEPDRDAGKLVDSASGLVEGPTAKTAREIIDAIERKVKMFDAGKYRAPAACDLAVYDNSEFGGFLDKQAVMDEVGALANSRDVRGRFR